ncbi:hypothetical protein ETAA8_41060 [Anatilimnocola aggregata]|uniref:Uncharacterized protein n=1 Tax=Anatilimnocola aggregata TaxID=2528021 RepID=A0A517YFJ4_9BACT|nr:hypothetical protein ETAA8_41060 [Anatilimnocola aggregata]
MVRMRGGSGKGWVEWLPGSDAKTARKSEAFAAEEHTWTERELKIPARRGESGVLRLYLPAGSKPVEVDWIELNSQSGKRSWNF